MCFLLVFLLRGSLMEHAPALVFLCQITTSRLLAHRWLKATVSQGGQILHLGWLLLVHWEMFSSLRGGSSLSHDVLRNLFHVLSSYTGSSLIKCETTIYSFNIMIMLTALRCPLRFSLSVMQVSCGVLRFSITEDSLQPPILSIGINRSYEENLYRG